MKRLRRLAVRALTPRGATAVVGVRDLVLGRIVDNSAGPHQRALLEAQLLVLQQRVDFQDVTIAELVRVLEAVRIDDTPAMELKLAMADIRAQFMPAEELQLALENTAAEARSRRRRDRVLEERLTAVEASRCEPPHH